MDDNKLFEQQLDCRERPLTVRRTNLREEFVKNGRPLNITEAIGELAGYRRDKAEQEQVFTEGSKSPSHRYSAVYARQKYAQGMDAIRALKHDYDRITPVLLTLKMDRTNGMGEGRAYVDHLKDLLASNSAVTQRLRYHIGKCNDFARLSVIEPSESGHAVIQHGLWVNDSISPEALQPAVEAHVEHCPFARDHSYRIKRVDSPIKLMERLGKSLIGWEDSIESRNPGTRLRFRRLGATLMAANTDQWRPDQGEFQRFVTKGQEDYEPDPDKNLGEYQGIRFEDGGDVVDADDLGGGGGGVNMVEVTDVDPGDDPVAVS